jgi:hypothetical protein
LQDSGIQISRSEFAARYAMYCFEIGPNFGDDGTYLHLLKQGSVHLEVQFRVALQFSRITLPDMGTLSTNNPI